MSFYIKMGEVPSKRHTVFRSPEDKLYHEELFGTEGFSGTSSLLYHLYPPTKVIETGEPFSILPEVAIEHNLKALSFTSFKVPPSEDYIQSRHIFFFNNDIKVGIAAPSADMTSYFYKNADADELLFIHKGSGRCKSMYGTLDFKYGDYVIIPRGTIYRLEFDGSDNRILLMESFSPITTPSRYRNAFGQHLEHSPFCERDFSFPHTLETHDERGEFKVMIQKMGYIYPYTYATHPFDLVGWDGYNYPMATSIFNFEPITGRVHMPPPVHQHFEGRNVVVCSFLPRMYDYHPQAIPAPYHHSNIDSDEILYYVDGDFMSRNDIESGQFTLHPGGIPHGPHPGAIERSIGQKETSELAVMIDPFHPLKITTKALEFEVKDYYRSWLEKGQ
jgi:homogentisate 1,2-dioxygenase